jgi:hypothetical protein
METVDSNWLRFVAHAGSSLLAVQGAIPASRIAATLRRNSNPQFLPVTRCAGCSGIEVEDYA